MARSQKQGRRGFLKTMATGAAGAAVVTLVPRSVRAAAMTAGPGNKWPGRIVIDFNKNAVTNAAAGTVDETVAKAMIHDCVRVLTGESSLGQAWKAIFPSSLSADSKIAIKVPLGCANSVTAPHWSSVKAVTDGLLQMDFDGTKFPAPNITIYEMHCSDNFVNFGYTSTRFGDVHILRDSESDHGDGADGERYADTLNSSDFLINVFRPGGHDTAFGGFTLGFKNHYGTYPAREHGAGAHAYLRDINCIGPVYQKNVLSVCVGLFGQAEASGDPHSASISYATYAKTVDSSITGSTAAPCTIMMSTDPITAEMQAVKMMRLNNGGGYDVGDMPKYLRESGGVDAGLSGSTQNIGVIDEAEMDIRRIINGNGTAVRPFRPAARGSRATVSASHVKGQRNTFIEFSVPLGHVGGVASIDIFNSRAARVWTASRRTAGVVNHLSWDERDLAGRGVAPGLYVARVTTRTVRSSTHFVMGDR
jgi:hypothetical protein